MAEGDDAIDIGEGREAFGREIRGDAFGDRGRAIHRSQHAHIIARANSAIGADIAHQVRFDVFGMAQVGADIAADCPACKGEIMFVDLGTSGNIDAGNADSVAQLDDWARP